MPISLRIPPEKDKMIQKAAKKSGTTKTAAILEAVDVNHNVARKYGIIYLPLVKKGKKIPINDVWIAA